MFAYSMTEEGPRDALFAGILGFLMLIAGIIGFLPQVNAYTTYETVNGTITDITRDDPQLEEDETDYNIEYIYTYDGEQYTDDQVKPDRQLLSNNRDANQRRVARQHEIGDTVTVHVNPNGPDDSFLSWRLGGLSAQLIIFGLGFFVVGIGRYLTTRGD